MCSPVTDFSREPFRDGHRRRGGSSRSQVFEEQLSVVNERTGTLKLRRRRTLAALSFYDNNETDENEHILSKWTVVRQRLPDILALSSTYKPTTVRAQLVLLVALMNKQTTEHIIEKPHQFHSTISHIVPSTVIVDVSGRSRLIRLKHIPSDQVIHVDIDTLSFSIPTRQFLLAISRGEAQEAAGKYCPPAVREMLIDLSKIKFVDERRQYKRAQFKMHIGQVLFFILFILIFAMICALLIAVTSTVLKIKSFDQTLPYIRIESVAAIHRGRNSSIRTNR